MIRKTYFEKILFNYFAKISEKFILDSDLTVFNFVLPKQRLFKKRYSKSNRTEYFLSFYFNSLNELNVYLTVLRKNRVTHYYFINIDFSNYSNIDDFILNSCIIGRGNKSLFLSNKF